MTKALGAGNGLYLDLGDGQAVYLDKNSLSCSLKISVFYYT